MHLWGISPHHSVQRPHHSVQLHHSVQGPHGWPQAPLLQHVWRSSAPKQPSPVKPHTSPSVSREQLWLRVELSDLQAPERQTRAVSLQDRVPVSSQVLENEQVPQLVDGVPQVSPSVSREQAASGPS